MLLYCRTDCCENLDFFLSLSKSTCNSIWSGINTVAQILCREWCIHLYLKKKSWETILVVEEPMTQHIVFNILGALKAVSILDQYSFPFSVLSIIAEQRLCILVLALCCLLYVGIYSLVFFSAAFVSQWTVIAESWISTSSSSEFSSVYNIEYTSCWLWLSKYYLMA